MHAFDVIKQFCNIMYYSVMLCNKADLLSSVLIRCCKPQVNSYERFTPLSIETEGLKRGYLDVQPGDCVVAFSRRDIYDIKQLIEASTGQR